MPLVPGRRGREARNLPDSGQIWRQLCRECASIEYGGSGNTGGYDPNGKSNYICRGCNKKFGMLSSMIQHQNARPQCAHMASLTSSTLSIGYT